MNQHTTHWGQHQDLHVGTLDDCTHEDCQDRRHKVLGEHHQLQHAS
jgi:hypothetical protein